MDNKEIERRQRTEDKIMDSAKKRNCTVTSIDFNDDNNKTFVNFINHDKDRSGNEFGECRMQYYQFLRGARAKNTMYEYAGKTSEEWIEEAKKVHPEYDYSKTLYLNCHKSVIVTCPKHGDFSVSPKAFIKPDYKCAKCKREDADRERAKEFLRRAHEKYGDLYDYEPLETLPSIKTSKVTVICPIHGEFEIIANNFLNGLGCPKCSKERNYENMKIGFDEFEKRSTEKYHGKYTYLRDRFRLNGDDAVCVCPEHGEFTVNIGRHLSCCGCPKCYEESHLNTERFIERARKVHGDKYDYSKVDYENYTKKVCIICPEHGEFWQTPKIHLRGFGCQKCSGCYMDRDFFIEKARNIHGDKYDYSKVVYEKNTIPVTIICPEHGEFRQTPGSHLNGNGCPICNSSHLEEGLKLFFERNSIGYVYQFRKKELFDKQSIDFYLPDFAIYVECQGEQHFISSFFKSKGIEYAEEHLKYIQSLDERKKNICKENNMHLVYYFDKKFEKYYTYENEHFCNENDLLDFIKNMKK